MYQVACTLPSQHCLESDRKDQLHAYYIGWCIVAFSVNGTEYSPISISHTNWWQSLSSRIRHSTCLGRIPPKGPWGWSCNPDFRERLVDITCLSIIMPYLIQCHLLINKRDVKTKIVLYPGLSFCCTTMWRYNHPEVMCGSIFMKYSVIIVQRCLQNRELGIFYI